MVATAPYSTVLQSNMKSPSTSCERAWRQISSQMMRHLLVVTVANSLQVFDKRFFTVVAPTPVITVVQSRTKSISVSWEMNVGVMEKVSRIGVGDR